jgi:hypothetical protein
VCLSVTLSMCLSICQSALWALTSWKARRSPCRWPSIAILCRMAAPLTSLSSLPAGTAGEGGTRGCVQAANPLLGSSGCPGDQARAGVLAPRRSAHAEDGARHGGRNPAAHCDSAAKDGEWLTSSRYGFRSLSNRMSNPSSSKHSEAQTEGSWPAAAAEAAAAASGDSEVWYAAAEEGGRGGRGRMTAGLLGCRAAGLLGLARGAVVQGCPCRPGERATAAAHSSRRPSPRTHCAPGRAGWPRSSL